MLEVRIYNQTPAFSRSQGLAVKMCVYLCNLSTFASVYYGVLLTPLMDKVSIYHSHYPPCYSRQSINRELRFSDVFSLLFYP